MSLPRPSQPKTRLLPEGPSSPSSGSPTQSHDDEGYWRRYAAQIQHENDSFRKQLTSFEQRITRAEKASDDGIVRLMESSSRNEKKLREKLETAESKLQAREEQMVEYDFPKLERDRQKANAAIVDNSTNIIHSVIRGCETRRQMANTKAATEKHQAAKMAQWHEAVHGIRSLGHEFTPMGWGFWPELYSYVHDSVKPLRLDTKEFGQIHYNFSVFSNTENFFLVDEVTWQAFSIFRLGMIAEHGYFEFPLCLVHGDMCTTMGRCGAIDGVMKLNDAEHFPQNVTEAAAVAAHALERASAYLEITVKTAVAKATRQEEEANGYVVIRGVVWNDTRKFSDLSATMAAAAQAVGTAATVATIAMTKAERLGKAYWRGHCDPFKNTATIQIKMNKSADTQALPDLSETEATIAMVQAKRKGSQDELETAQKTVAAQREMNKSAAAQALEFLFKTEERRIEVAQDRRNADPAIWEYRDQQYEKTITEAKVPSWVNAHAISATDDAVYTHQKKLRGEYDAKCAELGVTSEHTDDWWFAADQVAHRTAHRDALRLRGHSFRKHS
jgi:hypothetical protein